MESLVYSYALAKSLYESDLDYYDTFVPFVCMILADSSTSLNLSSLKEGLKERFQLDIPDHVLDQICNRGIAKGNLSIFDSRYSITKVGQSYTGRVLSERDVERKVNYLGRSLSEYLFQEYDEEIAVEQALDLFLSFVRRNLGPLTSFLESPQVPLKNGDTDKFTRAIVRFLTEIETENPQLFEIANDLVYGSVICTVVQAKGDHIPTTLNNVNVILDTNVLFSILGFDHEEVARPRKELLNLLKREGCDLWAFDFTIDEMVAVLKGYASHCHGIWKAVRVNSVYSNFQRQGVTPSDISSIIANMEGSLESLGVNVYKTDKDLFSFPRILDISTLVPFKVDSNERSLYHDMLAVREVQNLRRSQRIRKLEDADYIFVTADNGLAKYDLEENHHREANSIPNVIQDRILTQILWLKNPNNSALPLYSAIAAHSRNLFVERNVWKRFCEIVSAMDEAIASEELSVLLYENSQLEEVLVAIDDPDLLSEEVILSLAKEFRERLHREQRTIDSQHKAEIAGLERKISDYQRHFELAKEREAAAQEELNEIERRIKTDAAKRAETLASLFTCLIQISLLCLGVALLKLQPLTSLPISLLGICGIQFNRLAIKDRTLPWLEEKVYRRQKDRFLL